MTAIRIRYPKTALLILVAVHVLTGALLLRFSVRISQGFVSQLLWFALNLGLLLAQMSLLGIWAGLGTNHWVVRLLGAGLGMAYLTWRFVLPPPADVSRVLAFLNLSTIAIAAVLLIVRRRVAHIQYGARESSSGIEPFQFSIRQLLLLMFFTGCFLAIGRVSIVYFPRMAESAIVSLLCVTIALPSVWSMLGTSHPFVRSTLVLLIALGIGIVLGQGGSGLLVWCVLMISDFVFLHASLLIVRLCGFRMVRLSKDQEQVAVCGN